MTASFEADVFWGCDRMRAILLAVLCVVVMVATAAKVQAAPVLQLGDILWLDRGGLSLNSRIVVIDPVSGVQSVFASGGLLADGYSTDMTLDSNGDILVAQPVNNPPSSSLPRRIIRVDSETGAQSIVSSGDRLSQNPGGGGFMGIDREPDGNILVSNFASEITRIDPATGTQSLFAPLTSIAGLVVDDDTVWAIKQNPSPFRILNIDRTTGASTTLSLDFSATPGFLYLVR